MSRSLKKAILWAKQDSARVADSLKRIEIVKNSIEDNHKDSTVNKAMEKIHKDSIVKIVERSPSENIVNHRYHIIAGSFSNEENAKIRAREYFSKGYITDIIETSTRNGSKVNMVSVKSFDNLTEANEFLKEFKQEIDSTAWLYTNK